MEALFFLYGVEDKQVHYDGEKREESQRNPQEGVLKGIMKGPGVIVPRQATPTLIAVVGVEVERVCER